MDGAGESVSAVVAVSGGVGTEGARKVGVGGEEEEDQ